MADKAKTNFQFAAAPTRAIRDTSLSAADWRTLLAISSYDRFGGAGNGNRAGCYASQTRLAKDIGSTREQVNRSIKRLRANGHIDSKQPAARDQRLIYFVVFDPVMKKSQVGVTDTSQVATDSSHDPGVGCDETINQGAPGKADITFHNSGLESHRTSLIYSAKQKDISHKQKTYPAEAACGTTQPTTARARHPSGRAAVIERDMRKNGVASWHVEELGALLQSIDPATDDLNMAAHIGRVEEFSQALYIERFGVLALRTLTGEPKSITADGATR